VRNAVLSRYLEDYGTANLEGLNCDVNDLLSVERILILGCGTSYHAGYIAAYMLEDLARIPVQVEISSEFRYKNPIVADNTLVIAISQSGETADTMAAVRELKAKGARILGICNVQGSALSREAHGTLLLRAGAEIGVASTKAFTSQLIVLSLFTLLMARMRHMSQSDGQLFIEHLTQLPECIQGVLDQAEEIQILAKKYAHFDDFFFLGRHLMFPTALEGALKLKEISYVNANGYPAGELKHGPIALINEKCLTIGLCGNALTADKMVSNLREVKARKGPILAIVPAAFEGFDTVADDLIRVPNMVDELQPVVSTVATQLLAYYIAAERGAEIDQPRNLAKSVTVE
jgi:glucosamine--fructose-6-phosphate aminotransferase (isomerizing)